MKIAIDARMYGLEHAGIGRYVMNLIHEIEKTSTAKMAGKLKIENWEIILLVRKNKYEEIKKEYGKVFEIIIADYPHYSIREQLLLPLQLIKLRPDLVHFPSFNIPLLYLGRKITTIHDLIKHQSRGPETSTRRQPLYWFKYLIYLVISKFAVASSAKIIVPSLWTKKELIRQYHLPAGKIIVTYEGADSKFSIAKQQAPLISNFQFSKKQEILAKYKIKKPFVVYTGSLYPHKNIKRLIEAVKLLKISLVVVCARSVFFDRLGQEVKRLGAEKYVNLAGFVPDEELAVFYSEASAFVFPSLIEGFGLPGLEAMAAGLPVVAADSSCLPEIYGEAALYFNPLDYRDMAAKIKKVINNQSIRDRLTQSGYKQVAKYSWQKMAQQTLEVYARCLDIRPGQ